MTEPKFKIIEGHTPYPLAARTAGRVKQLRLLQVFAAYYNDRDRYGLAKEFCIPGVITSETEEEGSISFEIEEPTMGSDEFRDHVAALLFPEAPVQENADSINYDAVEDALDVFLGFIEPRHRKQSASLPWQKAFRDALISSTRSSMEEQQQQEAGSATSTAT